MSYPLYSPGEMARVSRRASCIVIAMKKMMVTIAMWKMRMSVVLLMTNSLTIVIPAKLATAKR